MLSGYTIEETIAERPKTIIYRAKRDSDGQSVIIKHLKADYPDLNTIHGLQHEYEMTNSLDCPGVVKAYSLEPDGNGFALVLEDFGGQSLSRFLATHELSVTEFLTIAIDLADILSQLHRIPLIHKDIKPSNIIIHPETQTVKLTDFNLATHLPFEYPASQHPNMMAGTLAYMSPEQTGRMNRYLDHRTDLYSLGVTFYEMLTGRLPFPYRDPLALIHAQIAEPPVPPHQHCSIPLPISEIIVKLLAKKAENGYRNASGLKFDLENCLRQWQETDTIESFTLGKRDYPPKLQLPQQLYGREQQIQTLLDSFESICQGNSEVVLISGYAGIGKTSLVKELYYPLIEVQGDWRNGQSEELSSSKINGQSYLISGKFDQLKRDTPYSAIIEAFQDLIRQLLTESQSELKYWQDQLQTALGDNGQIIIDLIPEVEFLIGEQPAVVPLTGTAAQNRFYRVFQQFLQVFCQPQHPLVLFLDDLQWADWASLQLMQHWLGDDNCQYLLLVGAYRDHEVTVTDPLVYILDKIQADSTVTVREISVQPLSFEQVHQFVTDTLEQKADPEAITQLSDLVYQKTLGNPFFMTQLLKTLDEEDLLQYNPERDRWHWDLEKIRGVGLTDSNLIELLVRNLQKLPTATQKILKLAACIGNPFNLAILATINQQSLSVTAQQLWPALQRGFVLSESEISNETVTYRFLHDRIQQAAYSLISETEKKATHLQIGQLLLQSLPPEQQEQELFTLINQLNLGTELLTSQIEKDQLIRLNFKAGQKAKAATAYELASNYFKKARQLLSKNFGKDEYHDLTLNVYLESAEVEYLNTNLEEALEICKIGQEKVNNKFKKVELIETEIKIYFSKNQVNLAVEKGENALHLLGVSFRESPPEQLNLNKLIDLPEMVNSSMLQAMEILHLIWPPACFSQHPSTLSILYTMLDLSHKHGNSIPGIFAYATYGAVLTIQPEIDLAYQAGQLALKLIKKNNAKSIFGKIKVTTYIAIFHKKIHIKETLNPLLEALKDSLEVGDIEYACYGATYYCEYSFFQGEFLGDISKKYQYYIKFIQKLKQQHQLKIAQITAQFVTQLQNILASKSTLEGDFLQESKTIEELQEQNNRIVLFRVYFYKAWLNYLFDNIQEAVQSIQTVSSLHITAEFLYTEYVFYYSLALLAQKRISSFSEEILSKVAENQYWMNIWAEHAPMNFQHRYKLVEAEKARVLGEILTAMELYDKAIAGARENGYIQHVALGNELAGEFYLQLGREKIAQLYLVEAHYAYQRWGATAKVKHLESKYPQFQLDQTLSQPKFNHQQETTIDSTTSSNSEELDLMSIV
ncbi:MAG: AAA family ATPase, partial [Halothece sp.]